MSSVVTSSLEPEHPDNDCCYPQMRFEPFRIGTLAELACKALPAGVRLLKLASDGCFKTREGLIVCYDCGLHYGMGHLKKCMADICNVPVALTNTKMKEERDGVEAVTQGTHNGLLKLKTHVRLRRLTNSAGIQPSGGGMDLSHMHSINSPRRERRRNLMEEAGFDIVSRKSVGCPDCRAIIQLENLTPMRDKSSLDYVLLKHTDASPTCNARPGPN